jgi:hypothetical protein
MTLTENYLDKLYTSYEPEIRGDNKPIENVDRRPNYIGMCINMLETDQERIGCLRKVREMTVMNPFYQHRIDRFIDAITDTYEPTDKPGFVEYIRGTKDSALVENINTYLSHLSDQASAGPPAKEIQLKSSGAEQDDEEPPTTARTKRFEKDEAKVGVEEYLNHLNEFDPISATAALGSAVGGAVGTGVGAVGTAAGKLALANPKIAAIAGGVLAGKALKNKIKKDLQKRCYTKHEGYPERIKKCIQGRHQ